MIVHLIGPGGAGKSTTAPALADALNMRYIDLDHEYLKTAQIDKEIEEKGYRYYVQKNVELYLALTCEIDEAVIATSSGFMTYDPEIHPAIKIIQESIIDSSSTVLLLASFDRDRCIEKTINRLLTRSYEPKSIEFQRNRIETRYDLYKSIGSIKVSTDKPVEQVVAEIKNCLYFGQPETD